MDTYIFFALFLSQYSWWLSVCGSRRPYIQRQNLFLVEP